MALNSDANQFERVKIVLNLKFCLVVRVSLWVQDTGEQVFFCVRP